jgi:hypothetical protein
MIVLTPRQQAAIKRVMAPAGKECRWHCRVHWQPVMGVHPHGGDHVCNRMKGHTGPCLCWRCGWSSTREETAQDLDRAAAMWTEYERGQGHA